MVRQNSILDGSRRKPDQKGGRGISPMPNFIVYSATAFYLALQRVSGWESMALTVAAQLVQRSAYPDAYAKWETDATALAQKILCKEPAGPPAP